MTEASGCRCTGTTGFGGSLYEDGITTPQIGFYSGYFPQFNSGCKWCAAKELF
jgi:hypothetical protein